MGIVFTFAVGEVKRHAVVGLRSCRAGSYFRLWRSKTPCCRGLALMPGGQLLSLRGESNQRRAKGRRTTLSGCFPSSFGIHHLFRRSRFASGLRPWAYCDGSVRFVLAALARWFCLCPRRGNWVAQHCIKQPSLCDGCDREHSSGRCPPRTFLRALRGGLKNSVHVGLSNILDSELGGRHPAEGSHG